MPSPAPLSRASIDARMPMGPWATIATASPGPVFSEAEKPVEAMSHQDLAGRSRLRGGARPAWAAAIPWGLGPAICVFVLSRFGLRQIARGRGDHWAAGGAPGISALAPPADWHW